MREIKFRTWDKDKKRFTYVKIPRFTGSWDIDFCSVEFNLSTGIKDKNGVEIYEGDILIDGIYKEFKMGRSKAVWYEDEACFVTSRDCGWERMQKRYTDKYEVIGNIYENPDLMVKLVK